MLGTAIGRTRASVSNIEAGRQHPPLHALYAIADALNVAITDLLPLPPQSPAAPSQREIDALRAQGVEQRDIDALFTEEVPSAASSTSSHRSSSRRSAT